jgi:hypothetical protein
MMPSVKATSVAVGTAQPAGWARVRREVDDGWRDDGAGGRDERQHGRTAIGQRTDGQLPAHLETDQQKEENRQAF